MDIITFVCCGTRSERKKFLQQQADTPHRTKFVIQLQICDSPVSLPASSRAGCLLYEVSVSWFIRTFWCSSKKSCEHFSSVYNSLCLQHTQLPPTRSWKRHDQPDRLENAIPIKLHKHNKTCAVQLSLY